ncbi:PTS fructose transporter subunit IIA [Caloramator sp. E03]|uniref:PTS sugar transporter subunit IIA n=1 Tax=Caloramator sp. E03 TaxID=2576307 RepID=UPI00111025A9|nr:fructose PTS transporter subunit IIA [Caloramator sp. E03]QCX33136.1 PTS fructose transporter subunit IIA [Caloramator sp. E03]
MSKIINENLIKLNLEADTREEVICELAKLIHSEGRLVSYQDYINEVFDREKKTSTGIGLGIAIPHGKCSAVKTPAVAFGRKKEGIKWDSMDGEPVKIVFLLAVPSDGESCNEHLRILAAISRRLLYEDFIEKLNTIESEKEIVELLQSVI